LENLVSIELYRAGELFYYQDEASCDFILRNNNGFEVYQVAFEMTRTTSEREIKGLVEAMKYLGLNHGTIITYDDENEIIQNDLKITVIPCWKWLLTNESRTGV
jgi:predicted AAA+ superfamily ATPase